MFGECLVNRKRPPSPRFFVSVHSREVKVVCFDTVLQVRILKELADALVCKKVTSEVGLILLGLEGRRGGSA